ncbi:MAG: hypothetical protein WKG07_29675 [Hymenobacter sp.]
MGNVANNKVFARAAILGDSANWSGWPLPAPRQVLAPGQGQRLRVCGRA